MIKVMLIDDEPWLIKGMEKIIDWNALGFEICATAMDGITGIELIKKHRPQLVFLDINMPQMTGLEVLKAIKSFDNSIRVVILSGYAEFAYAQKAIKFGASNYLLKPADEDELYKLLEEIKHSYDISEELWIKQITQRRITPDIRNLRETISRRLNLSPGESIAIAFTECKDKPISDEKLLKNIFAVPIGDKELLVFVRTKHYKNLEEVGALLFSIYSSPIGLSEKFSDFEQFNRAYTQARIAINAFWGRPAKVNLEPQNNISDLAKINNTLWKLYSNGDNDAFRLELEAFFQLLTNSDTSFKSRIAGYNILSTTLAGLRGNTPDHLPSEITLQNILNNNITLSYEELLKQLRNEFYNLLDVNSVSYRYENNEIASELAVKIKEYIDARFTMPSLSVKSISSEMHLNTAYLGQIFKKSYNTSIIEYITQKRVDYAEYLLKNKSMSIEAVSEKIGIHDYFYFNKLYKKYKGVSPGKVGKQIKD